MKTISTIALALVAGGAQSQLLYDQDVTPDLINGSGNVNGSFTVDRQNGVELGLRGKLRFNASNQPENTFNSNGDGTYSFDPGAPSPGFGWQPNDDHTAKWSFEWSINTDYNDSTGLDLADLTYRIDIDGDSGLDTNFLSFDPIHGYNDGTSAVQWDHAIGDNMTGNGGGMSIPNSADDAALYDTRINDYNVAQNSWNYQFFDAPGNALDGFDADNDGVYTITLTAFDGATQVAQTSINVLVPAPASAALLGLGGIAAVRRRR